MQMRRHAFLLILIGATVLTLMLAIPWQASQQKITIAQDVDQPSSSMEGTTIKVIGEASKIIEPDEVTIAMNVQTPPFDFQSIKSKHEEKVKRVVQAMNSAVKDKDEISFDFGQTTFNPFFTGSSADTSTVTAFARVHISTDLEHFEQLSAKISKQGYRIEELNVSVVREDQIERKVSPTVLMVKGSSSPNNFEFYKPDTITISSDDTVTWINNDAAAHTVTSGSPGNEIAGTLFDSGIMKPEDKFQQRFDEGVYQYFCQVHPWMTGTVLVSSNDNAELSQRGEFNYKVNFYIIIETEPDTLENAVNRYEEKFVDLGKILKEVGIETDFKQVSVHFNPFFFGSNQFTHWNAYSQIRVETDLENIDILTKAAQTAGASIESIFLSTSESALEDARKEMVGEALEDARSRAMEILQPLGLETKAIKRIETVENPINPNAGIASEKGLVFEPFYPYAQQASQEAYLYLSVEFEAGK